jgi:glycerol uptake facilitator-like aquaporin
VSVPGPARPALARRGLAEFTGTGLLAAVVVGSGIMAVRLSPGAPGLELLENSLATVAGLAVIIAVLAPVSGAHLNPVVSAADWALGRRSGAGLPGRDVAVYVTAQLSGGIGGAVLANLMFALPAVTKSVTARSAPHLWLGEVVATAGLVLVVFVLARSGRGALAPAAVAGWVGAAYWATSSTSFANPAVTIGRAFTGTFAGIAPESVPGFVAAQAAGAVLGAALVVVLYPAARPGPGGSPAEAGSSARARPETAAAGAVPAAGN